MKEIILSAIYLIIISLQYIALKKLECENYTYMLCGILDGIIIVSLTILIG